MSAIIWFVAQIGQIKKYQKYSYSSFCHIENQRTITYLYYCSVFNDVIIFTKYTYTNSLPVKRIFKISNRFFNKNNCQYTIYIFKLSYILFSLIVMFYTIFLYIQNLNIFLCNLLIYLIWSKKNLFLLLYFKFYGVLIKC